MQTLINDVRDQINSLNSFKYIDEDWGQLDDYSPHPPTKWPTALVDIIEAKPTNQGGHVQTLNITILVRVASMRLSPSSQGAKVSMRTKAEELFLTTQELHKKLHGWHKANSNYGTLSRIGFRRNHRIDGIREYQILYKTALKDATAYVEPTNLKEQVPNTIKIEISPEKLG